MTSNPYSPPGNVEGADRYGIRHAFLFASVVMLCLLGGALACIVTINTAFWLIVAVARTEQASAVGVTGFFGSLFVVACASIQAWTAIRSRKQGFGLFALLNSLALAAIMWNTKAGLLFVVLNIASAFLVFGLSLMLNRLGTKTVTVDIATEARD
jgi:MFS family permease